MLKKLYRFHGHGSLNYVHRNGQSARAGFLQLKYVPNKKRTESRLAVVVAKKVAKSAPERNRIRRRLYETMRQQWPLVQHPHDMIILVFDKKAGEMSPQELNRMTVELLHKANLYQAGR